MLVLVWLIPGKESRQQQVFAKFEELATSEGRRPGNGLGLAFGKLVVEARGGQIWIGGAQELGGSAFVMRLSLVDEVK